MTPDPNIADPNIADPNIANINESNESTDVDNTSHSNNHDNYEDVVDADDSPVAQADETQSDTLESIDPDSLDSIDAEASVEIEEAKAAFDAADDDSNGDSVVEPRSSDAALESDAASATAEVRETAEAEEEEQLVELAVPFVGQWNQLISTSNWEKGRIISQWRAALIESGVQSSQYSDEAWTRRVGGVTAPHVGRLRRVYDRFASTYETYAGLYWSHFLAALDWEDAPMWLEGATKENWSVAGMREQRWQAHGAVESNRPTGSQIVEVDLDEDVEPNLPAEGGGRTKQYGDESGVASGPVYEAPDFGEEDELMSLGGQGNEGSGGISAIADPDQPPSASVQPFAGLPELPDDLSDAVESFKLALLRHKTSKWEKVSAETVEKYLQAFAVLLSS
jgi:hypothetical protein